MTAQKPGGIFFVKEPTWISNWLDHHVDVEELGGDDLRAEYCVVLGRLEDDGDTAVTNPGFSGQLLTVCRGMRKQCGDIEF